MQQKLREFWRQSMTARIARQFDAHIDFLHVRLDPADMAAAMASSGAVMVPAGMVDGWERDAAAREARALAQFERLAATLGLTRADTPAGAAGPTAQWHRVVGREPFWLAEYGRTVDLLVVARPNGNDGVLPETLEAALLDSGRPLLIPGSEPGGTPATGPFETVAVAWKSSPSAARAVAAAVPFLAGAERIAVLAVAEDEAPDAVGAERLAAALRWRGPEVTLHQLEPSPEGVGETLIAAARGQGAALLVMGDYGHSRLREFVFGGVTRSVLRAADLPVLLAH